MLAIDVGRGMLTIYEIIKNVENDATVRNTIHSIKSSKK